VRSLRLAWILLPVLAAGCPTRIVYESDAGSGGSTSTGGSGGASGLSGVSGGPGGTAGTGGSPSTGGSPGSQAGTGGRSDAGTDAPSDSGSLLTWCTQQTSPPGIASADYGCADFDNGSTPGGNWSVVLASGGAATLTNQRASSLPDSWSVGVTNGDASKAALKWHVSGAQPISAVTVAADFSPAPGVAAPWSGDVSLLCIQFGSGSACLNYTNGGNTGFASGPYTGYYLFTQQDNGAVVFGDSQLYGTLQPNLWTRVQMRVTASSGSIEITSPGLSSGALSSGFGADTTVDVFVGPRTSGATAGWSGYIDNVVVYVSRSK
jgi:hypothetical protein